MNKQQRDQLEQVKKQLDELGAWKNSESNLPPNPINPQPSPSPAERIDTNQPEPQDMKGLNAMKSGSTLAIVFGSVVIAAAIFVTAFVAPTPAGGRFQIAAFGYGYSARHPFERPDDKIAYHGAYVVDTSTGEVWFRTATHSVELGYLDEPKAILREAAPNQLSR